MYTQKFFSTIFVIIFVSSSLMAQLKVVPVGRVHIGNEFNPISSFDVNNVMTMSLFGRGTDTYRVGSKLSFGDIGSSGQSSINVFVGENGTGDSDQIQLHGKFGAYVTVGGQGTTEAARFDLNRDLYVGFRVFANNVQLTSDGKLKKNIRSMDSTSALSNVLKMRGVTFDWKTEKLEKELADLGSLKPNETKDKESVEKEKKGIQDRIANSTNQVGFIAQEVQKVYPQLVAQSSTGDLSVNYTGMVPVLVEAIKDLKAQIDALKKEIEEIKKKMK
jgi:Chaperone of endosialidase